MKLFSFQSFPDAEIKPNQPNNYSSCIVLYTLVGEVMKQHFVKKTQVLLLAAEQVLVVPYRKIEPRSDSPCKYSLCLFSGYIGGRSQDLGRAGICS